jgi:hypothetical protein
MYQAALCIKALVEYLQQQIRNLRNQDSPTKEISSCGVFEPIMVPGRFTGTLRTGHGGFSNCKFAKY